MSFLRHGEIYRSDGNGRDGRAAAPLDRCDEFPNGYSSAGCSPAEPASAFSAMLILNQKLTRWLE